MKHLLREPLLHFLLIGAALFAVDHYVEPARGAAPSSKQIVLTLDDVRQLDLYFESQWPRPPTPQEFQAMVEDKVRERITERQSAQ